MFTMLYYVMIMFVLLCPKVYIYGKTFAEVVAESRLKW
jgi:hypothetical protein